MAAMALFNKVPFWLLAPLFFAIWFLWIALYILLAPFLLTYRMFLWLVTWYVLPRRGADTLVIHNGSERSDWMREITLLVGQRAITLDYSTYKEWPFWSLPEQLFHHFGPRPIPANFIPYSLPAVIVFEKYRWPKVFTFGAFTKNLEVQFERMRCYFTGEDDSDVQNRENHTETPGAIPSEVQQSTGQSTADDVFPLPGIVIPFDTKPPRRAVIVRFAKLILTAALLITAIVVDAQGHRFFWSWIAGLLILCSSVFFACIRIWARTRLVKKGILSLRAMAERFSQCTVKPPGTVVFSAGPVVEFTPTTLIYAIGAKKATIKARDLGMKNESRTPIFVLNLEHWDPPFENERLSVADRSETVQFINAALAALASHTPGKEEYFTALGKRLKRQLPPTVDVLPYAQHQWSDQARYAQISEMLLERGFARGGV